MLYLLRHEFGTTISEKWVGINQLRRYCEEGRIVGKVPDIIRDRLNYARPVKKVRKDKGKSRKKVKLVLIKKEKEPIDRSNWGVKEKSTINNDAMQQKMYYIWDDLT